MILNWNRAEDTLACLESLRESTIPLHLIVVDNGSADDSLVALRSSGLADTVIETGTNLGYSGGNNVGVRRALVDGFEVICVLNNDTVARPDCAGALLAALQPERPRAVSADIRYYDDPERSWFLGGRLERGWAFQSTPPQQQAGPTELLTGCCIAARREVWERVGLFDEDFFLTFEDFDWSLEARACGVELATVPEAILLHKVSMSFKSYPAAHRLGTFYFARNGMRFVWRWDRRRCLTFMTRQVLLPAIRELRRARRRDPFFLLAGIGAFAAGQKGRAPRVLRRIAEIRSGEQPGRNEVHVWLFRLEDVAADNAQLDEAERASAAEFAFEEDRRRFLAGRACLRGVCRRYGGVLGDPTRIEFAEGKPTVPGRRLTCSLSHSGDLIAVAVARRAVGLDVEQLRGNEPEPALVARACSAAQRRALDRVAPETRERLFLSHWVRKEALGKALGVGLDLDLAPASLAAFPRAAGRRHNGLWRVFEFETPAGYVGAVAGRGLRPRVVVRRSV